MKFDDLGTTFQCPDWTQDEIDEALEFFQANGIPAKFEKIEDTGIHIGKNGADDVALQKSYVDRNGVEVNVCDKGNFYFSPPDNAKKYSGKLYDGYEISVSRTVIPRRYRNLKTALEVAAACWNVLDNIALNS